MADIRRPLTPLVEKLESNQVGRRHLWTMIDVPYAWFGPIRLGGGYASIAARPQIRYIFDARDGGVLHGRYRNNPVGCGAIQWHQSHIYDMDEGGVKYGKRIPSIFEDMTIFLRSCSYSTHTLVPTGISFHISTA
jgi:hypothetical protein